VRRYRWLAAIPTIGMLGGIPMANRVRPYVFGLPFLLAWIVGWVIITSAIMAVIYRLDQQHDANIRDSDASMNSASAP
jgi:hypothetical protein